MVQHHHTCGRASPELARSLPTSLTPYGTSAADRAPGSIGSQKHKRGTTDTGLGQEANMRDLATPLASAAAGDVGAECDLTPLQSRTPRDGGVGAETAPEAASASGVESPSNGEGPGELKRKDTITWESFLANISVSDGAKEGGGANAEASASDSSSPAGILPREAPSEGPAVRVSWRLVFLFLCLCHALR